MNIDSLIDQLRPMSRDIERRPQEDGGYWLVTFPTSPGADYRFQAYVYEDGEASISAVRAGANDDEYFWGITFESPDFNSIEEIGQHLVDIVSRLLNHDTRIVQSKGLINVGFECAPQTTADGILLVVAPPLDSRTLSSPKLMAKKRSIVRPRHSPRCVRSRKSAGGRTVPVGW